MLGRHVQRVEAVPLVFDLGPFDDRESHAREDRLPSGRARCVSGWRWPSGGTRPGSVTSTAPRRAARPAAAVAWYSVQRASIACFSSLAQRPMLASSARAARCRSTASTTRRRCSCGRDSGRGPPARRAASRRRAARPRTRRSAPRRQRVGNESGMVIGGTVVTSRGSTITRAASRETMTGVRRACRARRRSDCRSAVAFSRRRRQALARGVGATVLPCALACSASWRTRPGSRSRAPTGSCGRA